MAIRNEKKTSKITSYFMVDVDSLVPLDSIEIEIKYKEFIYKDQDGDPESSQPKGANNSGSRSRCMFTISRHLVFPLVIETYSMSHLWNVVLQIQRRRR